MMLAEFESTGAAEISVFQRLLATNGTNPFRLVRRPTVIALQAPLWASARALDDICRTISASAAMPYLKMLRGSGRTVFIAAATPRPGSTNLLSVSPLEGIEQS